MTNNNNNKIINNNLSFEDALKRLEATVSSMENGDKNLDEVISNYEYGVKLKNYLDKKLDQAKLKISKISEQK